MVLEIKENIRKHNHFSVYCLGSLILLSPSIDAKTTARFMFCHAVLAQRSSLPGQENQTILSGARRACTPPADGSPKAGLPPTAEHMGSYCPCSPGCLSLPHFYLRLPVLGSPAHPHVHTTPVVLSTCDLHPDHPVACSCLDDVLFL